MAGMIDCRNAAARPSDTRMISRTVRLRRRCQRVSSRTAGSRLTARERDIVVDLAGQPVPSVAALQSVLAAHKPGNRVQARVSRDGTESTVQLTLDNLASWSQS
jgi:hypothetical protein